MEMRPVVDADQQQVARLGAEAFGMTPPDTPPRDRRFWGAFEDDRLVAQVAGLDAESWFAGARVPTCGVADVTVALEHRGRGLLRPLFAALTTDAVARGECVSTLFPTANGIYRSLGYEVVSSLDKVQLPTAQLTCSPPTQTTSRRAREADMDAVRATYAEWAAAQSGPLTRVGPAFARTDAQLLDGGRAVTLAIRGSGEHERVTGYLVWRRGDRTGADAVLTVDELVAVDVDAFRALWGVLASFGSVTGSVRLLTSGDDPARHVLRTSTWDVVARYPYALRLLDLPAAIAARPDTAPLVPTSVDLDVSGDRLGLLDGSYRLSLDAGRMSCERTSTTPSSGSGPSFTAGGIGLLWAGTQSCANLRFLGHLTGPSHHDAVLDAAFGGHQLHIRNYF